MIRGPKNTVSVLLPMGKYEKIKVLAVEQRRTVSSMIRVILLDYLCRTEQNGDAGENGV